MARTKAGLYPVKTRNGAPPACDWFPLVASTAYFEGQPLYLETTGSAARVPSGGTALLGFAGHDVTSASAGTKKMLVYLADSNTLFSGKMLSSHAPQSVVGDKCDFLVGTTHNYRLAATATIAQLKVVGFDPDEALTAHTGCMFYVIGNLYHFGQATAPSPH